MPSALEFLDRKASAVVSLAAELVRINTVNGNEAEAAGFIKKKLAEHGIESRVFGKDEKSKSLIARIGKGEKTILFNGHLDTVAIGDESKWSHSPFSGEISGGKLFGRGALDMKGGTAALAYAAIALKESGELKGRVILLFNYDEEGGGHSGIKDAFGSEDIKANACIIAESLKDKLVIGSRGVYRFEITLKGKTGHTGSSNPVGVNAVTKMARVLLALEKLEPSFTPHELCPSPTITPGTVISGGRAINIFPDECNALVDCRLALGQTRETITGDIKRAIEAIGDREISYGMRELAYSPAYMTSPEEPIVRLAGRAAKELMGLDIKPGVSGPMTDGNFIFQKGIPVIVLGPDGENMHSEDEFAYTESIVNAAKAYVKIAGDFFSE